MVQVDIIDVEKSQGVSVIRSYRSYIKVKVIFKEQRPEGHSVQKVEIEIFEMNMWKSFFFQGSIWVGELPIIILPRLLYHTVCISDLVFIPWEPKTFIF